MSSKKKMLVTISILLVLLVLAKCAVDSSPGDSRPSATKTPPLTPDETEVDVGGFLSIAESPKLGFGVSTLRNETYVDQNGEKRMGWTVNLTEYENDTVHGYTGYIGFAIKVDNYTITIKDIRPGNQYPVWDWEHGLVWRGTTSVVIFSVTRK